MSLKEYLFRSLHPLWAMEPAALTALLESTHNPGGDARAIATSVPEAERSWTADGPLAVIAVSGPLSKQGLYWGDYCLMDSMRRLGSAVMQAAADPSVRAILLDVDSPGGTVDGVEELADAVRQAAACKPVYAYADGLMASAAYWIACGAREIAAPATAHVGSIGVVMAHWEYAKALDDAGCRCTYIAAGKYKTAGNPVEPLSDAMRAYFQSGIDATYELFLGAVERGRNCDRQQALRMADGKVFMAGSALEAGLIDRVCGRETFITHIKESLHMTLAELKAQHADAVEALRAELLAETGEQHAEVVARAAQTARAEEQSRLLSLAGVALGAQAADRLRSVAESGVTQEQLAALKDIFGPQVQGQAQKEKLESLSAAHHAGTIASMAEDAGKKDFSALVKAYRAQHGVGQADAIRAVAASNPEEHTAWIRAQQKKEQQ